MFKQLSFRQKIFFSQIAILIIFITALIPVGEKIVRQVVQKSLEDSSKDLIENLQSQPNPGAMVSYLKDQERFVFFRASIIGPNREIIYDTHLPQSEGQKFKQADYPEVEEAFHKKIGYEEDWSHTFERDFAYVAIRFDFQGQPYVLRTAFPLEQMAVFVQNFQVGLFSLDILLFVLFSVTTWLMFVRFSQPIQQIIKTIKTSQKAKDLQLPHIALKNTSDTDFSQLATTLNNLSDTIRSHIRSILEERNEKEAILESLIEGVIAVDGSNTIQYTNFTGSKLMGQSKRHLIGNLFPQKGDPARDELFEKGFKLLSACQEYNTVVTDAVSIGNEEKQFLDLIAAPKPMRSGAILVIQDKSSHRKTVEMGRDFVANASHELRTPITVIRGFAETLQDLPDLSPDMLADITDKIVRSCQRMDTLVKNLLLLADIENVPQGRFQECDVLSLIENCGDMLRCVYPTAVVEVKGDKVFARADPDLLELAISNLLDNAAKYSKQPAHITAWAQEKGDEVEISIQDQGIGIPEKDLDHIFERFYTVNKAHSRKLGGAGLGLSIVKTIIEKHDGVISVTSEFGVGTTFTLLLPKWRQYHTHL